jgi:hypothetical protein
MNIGFGQPPAPAPMAMAAPAAPASNIEFDNFYMLVVSIAVVILILVLAFLGWTMSKHKDTTNFPIQTTCPDNWEIENDPTSKKAYCKQPPDNTYMNYGDSAASTSNLLPKDVFKDGKFDFTNSGWSAAGQNAVCAKKKWADTYKIKWDTVTNDVSC